VVDRKPCRIKYQFTEEGDKVRISKRSGRIIPKPIELLERKDFKLRSGYVDGPKDTKSEDVVRQTFVPQLINVGTDIIRNLKVSDINK
jgi:large subunit ribosomal protein L24